MSNFLSAIPPEPRIRWMGWIYLVWGMTDERRKPGGGAGMQVSALGIWSVTTLAGTLGTTGGPQHPHLVLTLPFDHFLQFLPSFQPCVLCKCMVVCPVWAAPLGPNMTHLSQLPRPRVEPKPGHERGRGVGGDRPNYGGLASLFLARVKSSRNWLCSWSLVDNCNVITW